MKKITMLAVALVMGAFSFTTPVMATNSLNSFAAETDAIILQDCANKNDDGKGGGIICVLELIVDILSIGVGILGVIGISVVGIQYLTAGGNEEQTRKAKRRMFEIILGLAVYAVIFALLKFLLPGFDGP